jgi:hypothetical protein
MGAVAIFASRLASKGGDRSACFSPPSRCGASRWTVRSWSAVFAVRSIIGTRFEFSGVHAAITMRGGLGACCGR